MVLTSNTVIFLCTLESTEHSYKQHIEKVKGKVRTRNNLLHKLKFIMGCQWTSTLRATALALCYSVAEYACPVWERSSHAKKVDASLKQLQMHHWVPATYECWESIFLAGIAPPGVRRSVASRTWGGIANTRHPCHSSSRLTSFVTILKQQVNIMGGTTSAKQHLACN